MPIDTDILALINVSLIALSFFTIVIAIIGIYIYWYTRVRIPPPEMVAPYLPTPPGDLSPGAAGLLLQEANEEGLVAAVLLHIARRGGLTVETKKRGDFKVTYREQVSDLRPMEKDVLSTMGLTEKGKNASLTTRRETVVPLVLSGLEEELRQAGYIRSSIVNPSSAYSRGEVRLAIVLIIASIVLALVLNQITSAGFCLPFGFLSFLIALLVLDRNRTPLTRAGAQARERWVSFRRYLSSLKSYTGTQQASELLERYLPYAVAFGIEQRFLNQFDRAQTPAPEWWIPIDWSDSTRTSRRRSRSDRDGGIDIDIPAGSGRAGEIRLPNFSLPSLSDASDRTFEGLGGATEVTFKTLDSAARGVGKLFGGGSSGSSSSGSSSSSSSSSDNDNDGAGGCLKAIGGALAALFTAVAQAIKFIIELIVAIFSAIWRALVGFWLVIWGQLVAYWQLLTLFDPVAMLIFGVGTAVLGSALVYWFWRQGGQTPPIVVPNEVVKNPPDDLAPAPVALLLHAPPAGRELALSFLWLELARREFVTIVPDGSSYRLTRTENEGKLSPIERHLLLENGLDAQGKSITLSAEASPAEQLAVRRVEHVLEYTGYLHTARGRWYRIAGVAGIVVTIITGLFMLFYMRHPAVLFPFIGGIIPAVLLIVLGARTRGLLEGGGIAIGLWQSFTTYLSTRAQQNALAEDYAIYLYAAYPEQMAQYPPEWWQAGAVPRRPVPLRSDWGGALLDVQEAIAMWRQSLPFASRA